MPLVTKTHLFGFDELWIYPITTDNETQYSVGTGIQLTGAKTLSMDFEIEEKELTGDESILRISTKVKKVSFSGSYALLNLEALKTFTGGKLVASGSTPNQQQTYSLQDGAIPGYFQLVGVVKDADVGAVKMHIMNCKMTAHSIGAQETDFQPISFSGTGITTEHKFTRDGETKGLLLEIKMEETATDVSAIEDEPST